MTEEEFHQKIVDKLEEMDVRLKKIEKDVEHILEHGHA